MAERRMFSLKIVDTDAFLDMPQSSQLLYFHLAMRADDDGFVDSPKKIMKVLGSSSDDYKVLISKRFILPFDTGVCVIKHWLIHNYIRNDRYQETKYLDEKKTLSVKDNKSYTQVSTIGIPSDNQMETQVRLGKDRLGEKNTSESKDSQDVSLLIKSFEVVNPACKKFYGNTTQRKACKEIIDLYSFERVLSVIEKTLPKTNGMQYFPTITTPLQLRDKWVALESAVRKYQSEKQSTINKNKVAFT